jgi:outer membrane receptor protein involved in Fe transport
MSKRYLTSPIRVLCWLCTSFAVAEESRDLEGVVVTGKAENLLEQVSTSSEGYADAKEIAERPLMRRSELLEIVPGMITTQHAGGGKATQYFLRGFNLDHGTDFAVSVDHMPMNMRSHAHGQGYADLNGLVPELVKSIDYTKGTYSARQGDLSSAGSANFELWDRLPRGIATMEMGEYDYYRTFIADSFDVGQGVLTLGGEWNTYDGPWQREENFQRWNGFARYFLGNDENHLSVTAMGYGGEWDSSDQIAKRAVQTGLIDRFGNLDDTTGGDSSRYSLQFDWKKTEGKEVTTASAYAVAYDLDLFSNFTYFLDNPAQGDQFQQQEQRMIYGGEVVREWQDREFLGRDAEFSLGFQTRHDVIDDIGLYKTQRRQRLDTVRVDDVYEASYGVFAENTVRWKPWFRTIAGIRADAFHFDVSSDNPANSGSDWDAIVSPKFSAIFGPWKETELYLNFGTGFHSNDARGVNNTVDPVSGDPLAAVDPLVRTIGGEIGLRSQIVTGLTSTLSLWWLDSDSELVYVGDAGTNEAGPASRRFGVEWSNYWRPNDWLSIDGELALTHARFRDQGSADEIPNSIPVMFSGGISLGRQEGYFGSLRVRSFLGRPLEETGEIEGRDVLTANAQVGYRTKDWEVALQCLNLLDRNDNDIEYYYTSQLSGEASAVDDIHYHPAEPRMIRMRVSYFF